jgi:hypothetical protein
MTALLHFLKDCSNTPVMRGYNCFPLPPTSSTLDVPNCFSRYPLFGSFCSKLLTKPAPIRIQFSNLVQKDPTWKRVGEHLQHPPPFLKCYLAISKPFSQLQSALAFPQHEVSRPRPMHRLSIQSICSLLLHLPFEPRVDAVPCFIVFPPTLLHCSMGFFFRHLFPPVPVLPPFLPPGLIPRSLLLCYCQPSRLLRDSLSNSQAPHCTPSYSLV